MPCVPFTRVWSHVSDQSSQPCECQDALFESGMLSQARDGTVGSLTPFPPARSIRSGSDNVTLAH